MNNNLRRQGSPASKAGVLDAGLREFLTRVYNYMALGLGITGLVSLLVSSSPMLMKAIFGTPLLYVALFAPVILSFVISLRIHTLAASTVHALFLVYSALMGVSLSSIFIMYTHSSIARVFFITASVFGAMSIYGNVTKKDLSSFGSFLFMGLIGVFLASIINIFLHSSALQFAVSIISVLVFTGLTAYDTQMIKGFYYEADSQEVATKKAVFGALQLYLDFINIFISLLRLFGDHNERK